MTDAEIIAALDAMKRGSDNEREHSDADELLLKAVSPEVASAWRRACERVGFWYA